MIIHEFKCGCAAEHVFKCVSCRRVVGLCMGGADDTCNDCWYWWYHRLTAVAWYMVLR